MTTKELNNMMHTHITKRYHRKTHLSWWSYSHDDVITKFSVGPKNSKIVFRPKKFDPEIFFFHFFSF